MGAGSSIIILISRDCIVNYFRVYMTQMSPRVYRNLDEIFAGEYEGMRYDEIRAMAPSEAHLRSMDKIGYRYPRGESYFDILA